MSIAKFLADAARSGFSRKGVWTPVITFATPGNLAVTYSQQLGRWSRVADEVQLWWRLETSAFTWSTAAASLTITGSPFTASNLQQDRYPGGLAFGGITKAGYTQFTPILNANASAINVLASGSGVSAANVDAADMPSGGSVLLRGSIKFLAA